MTKKIERLNSASKDEAEALLLDCCGSRRWARTVAESRPFEDFPELDKKAEEIWNRLACDDWLEAFAAHPKIGSRKPAPAQQERAAGWSKNEQSGTTGASDAVLSDLDEINRLYKRKFGYIFIVCATGKAADEMLGLARDRLNNGPDTELKIAVSEQSKITRIRLERLFMDTEDLPNGYSG